MLMVVRVVEVVRGGGGEVVSRRRNAHRLVDRVHRAAAGVVAHVAVRRGWMVEVLVVRVMMGVMTTVGGGRRVTVSAIVQ